jgi:chromosome segregation ATPase
LDKFKFVLEHRIKELRKNIEPKAREIVYLKQQNTDMENELDATISVRSGLQLQVSELQNKLSKTDQEYNKEKKTRMRLAVLLERIRGHMTRCMSVLHDHNNLKATVKAMYQKYGEGTEAGKASSAEQEAICELVRQKHHLEISLDSIKRKLNKDAQFTRSEQLKIMHENMLLVYEINNLRAELKRTRDKVTGYEKALGFNAAHAGEASEMRFKLQHAIEERDEIDISNDHALEIKNLQIEAQQEEIDTLSTKILKIHEYVHDTARPDGIGVGNAAVDHIRSVLTTNNAQTPLILNNPTENKETQKLPAINMGENQATQQNAEEQET